MKQWLALCLALVLLLPACKKKKDEPSSGLPANSEVMEIENGWEVVGQHEIPLEWQVDNVTMPFLQMHRNQADVVFITETQLQTNIMRKPHRWRLNLKGNNISTTQLSNNIFEGEGKTGQGVPVTFTASEIFSKGMGDRDLMLMSSAGVFVADSTGSTVFPFSWKGSWQSGIYEFSGPFGALSPRPFMLTPVNTFGGPVLGKVSETDHYIYYSTDLRPAGGGVNSKGELVTLTFNWRYPESVFVYASTRTLLGQTLQSTSNLCYVPVLKNAYKLSDLSRDSVVSGADKIWMWHMGSDVHILVKYGSNASMFKLNIETYALEVEKTKAVVPEYKATLVKDKPGQFFDLANRNVGRMYNGTTWTNVQRPRLRANVGAYMWDMCYSEGYAWLLVEYKKTMVLLRSPRL